MLLNWKINSQTWSSGFSIIKFNPFVDCWEELVIHKKILFNTRSSIDLLNDNLCRSTPSTRDSAKTVSVQKRQKLEFQKIVADERQWNCQYYSKFLINKNLFLCLKKTWWSFKKKIFLFLKFRRNVEISNFFVGQ